MSGSEPGFLILLNGTSSSGKSAIAKSIQVQARDLWIHVEIDAFLGMIRPELLEESSFLHLLSGVHGAVGALTRAGNRVIFDTVLQEGSWLTDLASHLDGIPVLFVGVQCPLEVLEERESTRERNPGTARNQIELVHRYGPYDLEVDTSVLSETEGARLVLEWLRHGASPTAFARSAKVLRDQARQAK